MIFKMRSSFNSISKESSQPIHEFLFNILARHEEDRPNQPIFVDFKTGEETTFTQIYNRTCSIAHFLQQNGFQKGDLVLTAVENRWQYVSTMLACSSLGGGVAGSNPMNTAYELSHQIRLTKPKIVLCQDYTLPNVLSNLNEEPFVKAIIVVGSTITNFSKESSIKITNIDDIICHPIKVLPKVEFDPETTVYFVPPSSGTAGLPKAIQWTHGAHLRAMKSHIINGNDKLGMTFNWRDHHVLLGIQCGYVYNQRQTIVSMINGSVGVFITTQNKDLYCECIEKYQIALVHSSPDYLQGLNSYKRKHPNSMECVKVVVSSGAMMKKKIRTEFAELFPGVKLLQLYGMSEGQVTIPDCDAPSNSVGRLLPELELRVIDPRTRLELGHNQPGEIHIRSNTLALGYKDNPKANAELFAEDGFLITGDIGSISEEGHLYLVDRQKEMIKVKGNSVAPAQLEDLMLSNKKVRDCCVIGVPDEVMDERVYCLVVRADSTLTEDECIHTVNAQTISYKHISRPVFFIDEIPKNLNGKPLRRVLREYVQNSL